MLYAWKQLSEVFGCGIATSYIYISQKSGTSAATNCYSLNASALSVVVVLSGFFGPIRSFGRTVPGERPADSLVPLVAALTDRLRPIFLRQRNTVRRQRQPLAIHGLAQCYLGPFACVADLPSRQSLRFVGTNRLVVPISRLSTVGIAKLFWSVSSLPGGKEASIRCKGASRNSTWNRIRVDNTQYRVSTSTSAVELTV